MYKKTIKQKIILCTMSTLTSLILSLLLSAHAQIGSWSSDAEIQISDIFWPSDSPTPPSGRPAKYMLKVVTLDEDPYVKYSDPDPETGMCPPMSYKCRMQPENITNRCVTSVSPSLSHPLPPPPLPPSSPPIL